MAAHKVAMVLRALVTRQKISNFVHVGKILPRIVLVVRVDVASRQAR